MASTGTPIVALALTSTASSLTLDDRQNELSSSPTPSPSVASHLQLLHATNAAYPMNGWHQNHLQFYPNLSVAHLYAGQHEYVPLVESDRTSSRDTSRKASSLLDTRQWSQVPNFSASYATSGTPFNIGYPSTDVGSSRFTGSFPADGTPARGIAPELQVISPSQTIPDLSSDFPSPTRHYHTSLGTDPDRPASSTSNLDVLPSSPSSSAEDITNFVYNERQPPVMIYRPPEKTSSGRRRCQRACAINIAGLWIDKDDLYTGAGHGSGMISVHECHWAKSSDPCETWIIGSRSRVSAHIRKWHAQKHVERRVKCLWDGCTTSKAMLKDSINRHVVTVHLDEGFHCQGCNEFFSRKDVYGQHVESGEVCREAGAAIVYGTERREIDARQALQLGGHAVRYSGC